MTRELPTTAKLLPGQARYPTLMKHAADGLFVLGLATDGTAEVRPSEGNTLILGDWDTGKTNLMHLLIQYATQEPERQVEVLQIGEDRRLSYSKQYPNVQFSRKTEKVIDRIAHLADIVKKRKQHAGDVAPILLLVHHAGWIFHENGFPSWTNKNLAYILDNGPQVGVTAILTTRWLLDWRLGHNFTTRILLGYPEAYEEYDTELFGCTVDSDWMPPGRGWIQRQPRTSPVEFQAFLAPKP